MSANRESDPQQAVPQRTRICRALTQLCQERGYKASGLPLLLDRAGVGEPDFLREFDDLEDCFCTVLEEQRAELMARAWRAFSEQVGWVDQIRAVGSAMLSFAQEDEARAYTMLVEAESGGERAKLIRDQGMEAFSAFIDLGRQELDDPDSISRATAEALGGAIFSQVRSMVEQGEFDELSDALPEMMYSIVLPYVGAEAAMRELKIPL